MLTQIGGIANQWPVPVRQLYNCVRGLVGTAYELHATALQLGLN